MSCWKTFFSPESQKPYRFGQLLRSCTHLSSTQQRHIRTVTLNTMGVLRHCRRTEESSLYTSRLHNVTYWIRNLAGHTVCLDTSRHNIIFPSHELTSDSSVFDLGCANPSSWAAVATRLCVGVPNDTESSFRKVLRFKLPAVF